MQPSHGPRTQPPRLLFVDNDLRTFQSHRLPLARAAQALGFEVTIAAPLRGAQPEWAKPFQLADVAIDRRSLNPLRELAAIWSLWRIYRKVRPDLVHNLRLKPVLYGGIAARCQGVPAVISSLTGLGHLFTSTQPRARFLRRVAVHGLRFAFGGGRQRILFQNREDQALFVRLGLCREGGSKVILGSGVDLDEIQPLPQPGGTPVVIFPGRVLYEKGAAEFAAAARELQRSGVRAHFAIVGAPDPASRSSVPAEVLQSWVSAGILEWWGWREDMLQVFRQSHIVCLPSYGEGVPRVLIEAAAAERAIVATRVPGCQEIVHDGVNGFLAPPREVRPLVDALRALIADSALRDRFGKAGREIVRRQFTLDRVLAETTGVYTDLLASAGDRNLAAFA